MPQKIPWPIQPRIKCLPRTLKFSIPSTPTPFIRSRMVRVSSPNLLNRPNILFLSRHLAGRLRFHRRTPNSTMMPPRHHHCHRISNSPSSPVIAPRPMSSSPSRSPCQPIFVPFRQDTSSPDLILKKKVPLTRSASTQTPTTIQKAWYPTHTSWLFHIPMWVDWWIIMEMGVLPCVCLALIPFALHAFSFWKRTWQSNYVYFWKEFLPRVVSLPLRSLSERNRSCIQISNITLFHLWQCTVQ